MLTMGTLYDHIREAVVLQTPTASLTTNAKDCAMATKPLPSQETLRQLLRYEPETGKLYWNKRLPELFTPATYSQTRQAEMWNAAWANKEAFTSVHPHKRYKCGSIFGVSHKAHRVIWKLVHNEEPPQIDHINGNPSDNTLSNLRACNNSQNQANKSCYKNAKCRSKGVSPCGRSGRFIAQIQHDNKKVWIGSYSTEQEASAAYRLRAKELFGDFANEGIAYPKWSEI